MCPMGGVHTVSAGNFGKCEKCGCIFAGGGYKFRRTKRTKSNKKRKTKRKKSNKKRKTKRKI
jgi:ribosomal protein L37AE/L43A